MYEIEEEGYIFLHMHTHLTMCNKSGERKDKRTKAKSEYVASQRHNVGENNPN